MIFCGLGSRKQTSGFPPTLLVPHISLYNHPKSSLPVTSHLSFFLFPLFSDLLLPELGTPSTLQAPKLTVAHHGLTRLRQLVYPPLTCMSPSLQHCLSDSIQNGTLASGEQESLYRVSSATACESAQSWRGQAFMYHQTESNQDTEQTKGEETEEEPSSSAFSIPLWFFRSTSSFVKTKQLEEQARGRGERAADLYSR